MTNIVVVEVAGILVSGIVGPVFVSLSTRYSERMRLMKEEGERRRDELHGVVEEAAKTLGEGSLTLREAERAAAFGDPEPPELGEWSNRVYLIEQRLLLRLQPDDPVIKRLDDVLEILDGISDERRSGSSQGGVVRRYDEAQRQFLAEARAALAKRDFSPEP